MGRNFADFVHQISPIVLNNESTAFYKESEYDILTKRLTFSSNLTAIK